jgi:hypothetical protein
MIGPGLFAPEHSVLDRESWDCRSPFTQIRTLKLIGKKLLLLVSDRFSRRKSRPARQGKNWECEGQQERKMRGFH